MSLLGQDARGASAGADGYSSRTATLWDHHHSPRAPVEATAVIAVAVIVMVLDFKFFPNVTQTNELTDTGAQWFPEVVGEVTGVPDSGWRAHDATHRRRAEPYASNLCSWINQPLPKPANTPSGSAVLPLAARSSEGNGSGRRAVCTPVSAAEWSRIVRTRTPSRRPLPGGRAEETGAQRKEPLVGASTSRTSPQHGTSPAPTRPGLGVPACLSVVRSLTRQSDVVLMTASTRSLCAIVRPAATRWHRVGASRAALAGPGNNATGGGLGRHHVCITERPGSAPSPLQCSLEVTGNARPGHGLGVSEGGPVGLRSGVLAAGARCSETRAWGVPSPEAQRELGGAVLPRRRGRKSRRRTGKLVGLEEGPLGVGTRLATWGPGSGHGPSPGL